MEIRKIEDKIYECFVDSSTLQKKKVTVEDIIGQTYYAKELVEDMLTDIYNKTGIKIAEHGQSFNMTFFANTLGIIFYVASDMTEEDFGRKIVKLQKAARLRFEEYGKYILTKEAHENDKHTKNADDLTGEDNGLGNKTPKKRSTDVMFGFYSISAIMDIQGLLPDVKTTESTLYKSENIYYLLIHNTNPANNTKSGEKSLREHFKICYILTEFSEKVLVNEKINTIKKCAEVLISTNALQKLTSSN